jgi:hypothetical protein
MTLIVIIVVLLLLMASPWILASARAESERYTREYLTSRPELVNAVCMECGFAQTVWAGRTRPCHECGTTVKE